MYQRCGRGIGYSKKKSVGRTLVGIRKLERKSIYAVLDVMKETFEESGDYEKSIYKTALYAHDTAESKLKKSEYSQLWRYNRPGSNSTDGNRFWGSFYDNNSKSDYGGNMGKLIKSWENFNEILKSNNLLAFKRGTFENPSGTGTFKCPVFGGYSDGKWWGTNLNDLV